MDKKILVLETKKKIQHFIKQNPTGIVIIRGATATGKSSLSLELSKYFDMEIISADSRQIFKYMDIGTDKVVSSLTKMASGVQQIPPLSKGVRGFQQVPPLSKGVRGFLKGGEFYLPYNPKLKKKSQELRKNMTNAEKGIWNKFLRLQDYNVARQKIIDNYIVDFYIASFKLVIEIDGETHWSEKEIAYDKKRTETLEYYGLTVVRFTNTEVYDDFEEVCKSIQDTIKNPPTPFNKCGGEKNTMTPFSKGGGKKNTMTPFDKGGVSPAHHQIDIVEPDETYTAGQWQQDIKRIIPEIQAKGKIPFIVGGTGLYIDTIYKNFDMPEIGPDYKFRDEMFAKEEKSPGILYQELLKIDPQEAKKHHPNSTRYIIRALEIYHKSGKTKTESFLQKPIDQPILMLGIWRDKESTNKLIATRIKQMIKDGLIHEVKGLLEQGYTPDLQSMQGIGYKEVVGYIQGDYNIDEMEELLNKNTCHLAKKQRTWFRRYIDDGKNDQKKGVYYEVLEV